MTAIFLSIWLFGASLASAGPVEVHYNTNLAFGSQSLFVVEMAGANIGPPTEYDRLIVDGQVSVGGTLELMLIDGFDQSITNDDAFTVMETTNGILGQWANVASGQRLNLTSGNGSFLVEYGLGSSQPNNLLLSNFRGPMTATWLGGDDAWFNAAGWDINQVPMNQGHDFFDVVINSGTVTVASNVAIAGLTNTSSINGGGDLAVDTLDWSHGAITGSGSLLVKQGGVIDNPGSSMNLSRQLINQGVLTWGSTPLFGDGSGSIQNNAVGTLILSGGGGTTGSGPNPGPDIVNDGTLRMTGVDEGDAFEHARPLTQNEDGSLDVRSGRLVLEGGGTLAGSIHVAAGAQFRLASSSSHPLSIVGDITGPGRTVLASGEATFDNTDGSSVTGLTVIGGTLGGSGPLSVDELTWTGGTITGSRDLVIRQTATIDNPGSSLGLSRRVVNRGTLNWENVRLFGNGAGSIQNDPGANLHLTGGGTTGSGPNLGPDIVNDGTLRMTGVDVGDVFEHERPLTNNATGIVDIKSGTLSLEGGGDLAGTVQVASGAVLKLTSPSDRPLSITTNISGPGTTILESGYAYFDNPTGTTVGSLRMNTQGHLSGSGRVTVENLTWSTSASMQGSGITTVTGNMTLDRINNPLNRRLFVEGVLDWQGGNLFGSGTLHVRPGAVAHLITEGRATQTATTIINDGTILVDDPTAAAPDFDLGNTFANNGLIQIEEGTLRIDGIVTNGGDIQVNGGTLVFAGESTGSITGGDVSLDGSATRIDGVYSVRSTTISTGHGVRFDTPTAATETLNLPGGVIEGSGQITAGTFNWTGGSLRSTVIVTDSATIDMSSAQFNGGHVDNRGALDWRRGTMGGGGTITNGQGAQMLITGTVNRATPSIVNLGTLTKRDAAVVTVDASFDGSGTTIVDGGTLNLRNTVVQHVGATLTGGTWEVHDGATLTFNQSGAVDIRTNQGAVVLRGPASTFARFDALADNRGRFEINDGRNFATAGDLINSGDIVVGAGSTLSVSGRYVHSGGTVSLVGGTLTAADGTSNSGQMVFRGTTDVSGDVTNDAAGRIVVAAGSTTMFLGNVDTMGADIDVASGGNVVFKGSYNGGTTGGGTSHVFGRLRPGNSPAAVAFGGDVVFESVSTTEIEIGGTTPGDEHDQINVNGEASLAGTIDVSSIDAGGGDFSPSIGDRFVVATFASHNGIFGAENLPALSQSGALWIVDYGDTALTLSVGGLPGDINLDGTVNNVDVALFSAHHGTPTGSTWTTGDFTFDGATTLADLALLQAHLGQSAAMSPSAAAVPEPSTAALILCGLVAIAARFANSTDRRGMRVL